MRRSLISREAGCLWRMRPLPSQQRSAAPLKQWSTPRARPQPRGQPISAFYSKLMALNRPRRPRADLATLTRAPRPVHIAQECPENKGTNGDQLMQDGETEQRAETNLVSSSFRPVDDPRVYLAAERTFLAWVRTAVALMGFGFLIARFAL